MKKVLFLGCFLINATFAATVDKGMLIDSYQDLCAKEKDPIKRHNYCHILDRHSNAPTGKLAEVDLATATV